MTIICVEDEAPVLELHMSMCRELPQKPETVGFQRADEALVWLKENAAAVALLDVNLPDLDGISLAEKIKELQPGIAVIFLTCHPEYALKAFGVHASGYLLKPVKPELLAAEIAYAMNVRRPSKETALVSIRTFGEFDVFINGSPIVFDRARAKELLAFLVDRQGGFVTRANAFSVLWEDRLYDRSMQKQLDVVIRSLRSTLKKNGIGEIVELRKGALRVIPEKLDCDLYRFFNREREAVNAYRGEYMSAYSWASLTEAYMDRIRHKAE